MVLTVKVAQCSHCLGTNLVKNGFTSCQSQRCLCKDCHKSRVPLHEQAGIDLRTVFILLSFRERLSLRGIIRVFKLSWNTLYALFNDHVKSLSPHRESVAPAKEGDSVEYDELCSFVGNKGNKCWLWVALSRETRQVIAWVIGDRSNQTFKRLLKKMPSDYLKLQSYSDHWKSYRILLGKGNHRMTDKQEGQTCHIERWNCTLRQRMSRFVRKSLAFSKKVRYHNMAIKLFVWFYNMEIIHQQVK
jgi:insertion element IS1 protein InsB